MAGKQAEVELGAAVLDELGTPQADTAALLAAAAAAAAETGEPVILEAGRYRLYQAPDGAWVVARAVGLCETCQGCGCGDQAGPIQIPALVIKLALTPGGGLLDKLKAIRAAGKAER
jgi:hypothetical protein